MYVPAHFELKDVLAAQEFVRKNVFATLAAQINERIHFAYAPTVFDATSGNVGCIRFHLARANPISALSDGDRITASFLGSHAYVSPDWYKSEGLVPTWNYVAVEGEGTVLRLSECELRKHLGELAYQEESLLARKEPWTLSRVRPERLDQMLNAIVGFRLELEELHGKVKLSQNRSDQDIENVIVGLELRGDPASLAVASAMRSNLTRGKQ